MSVELYHFPGSLCSQKVRLALAEKGVEWKEHVVNILRGDNLHPDYIKKNSKGVVPTLVHDGKTIINSRAILEYIDAEFDGPSLSRGDEALTAAWLQLQDLLPIRALTYGRATGLLGRILQSSVPWKRRKVEKALAQYPSLKKPYAAKVEAMKAWEVELSDPRVASAAIEKVTDALDALDAALASRTWLAGEHYTIADSAWTPVLVRLEAVGLQHLWSDGTRSHLARYVEQVKRRPSFDIAISRFAGAHQKSMRAAALALYKARIVLAVVVVLLLAGVIAAWPQISALLGS